ncbi:hypothetical protein M9Y10_001362 [Tritrichomonas musculus]|uniref:Initiator binding domain-containing protein n=1 Tax=Tritrichomonas musculus TaxID=1915356 RepID=A0ABR2L6W2_9EUKA
MSEKSRLCSTIKDLKDEKRNLQSQINLLSKKSNDVYQELASESDYFYEMMNQLKEKFPVLTDLVLYALKMKKQYDDFTFVFANSIKTSSPKIYNMLIEKLGFPSTYKCDKYTPPINTGIAEYYLDDSRIPEIIQKWKKQNNLKSHDEIQACLSVDALFFTPDIHITYENEVSGMLLNKKDIQKLPLHVSEIFLQNPRLFESFLNFNKNKIIRCAFVFQIQPFRVDLPTFTCHIIPTTSGKSNDDIVKMLINIKNIANNHKIFIKTFAFDGDGAYNELHKQYYKSYFNYTLKNNYIKIVSKSKVYRVVCDMLHLLKRLRYRLLSCIIHPGFRKSKTKIDLDKIKL